MANLQSKVVAITGGASGIGLATSIYLAKHGAAVSIADIQENALRQAEDAIASAAPGARILTAVVDVRKREDVDTWISKTVAKFGKLDGAANLAGVFPKRAVGISQIEDYEWNIVMDINLTGLLYCVRAQLREITAGGSIVNASSFAGIVGNGDYPAYTVSKFGVIGLSRCAAKDGGKRSVRVNSICPGVIETPMTEMARGTMDASEMSRYPQALPGKGLPEDVAALIAFLLGDESKFITASTYQIDGGRLC